MDQRDHVVVVGGSSGIGLWTAKHLVARGIRVTVAGRNDNRLNDLAGELKVSVGRLDAGDHQQVREALRKMMPFQHLVISIAGGAALGPFERIEPAAFRETFDGKFWPYANLLTVAAAVMKAPGSICMVTGASAIAAAPGAATLAAVNGALEGMVKTLAVELAPLRVNAVSPGLTDTEAWGRIPEEVRQSMYEQAAANTPAGRVGQPEDVAHAICSVLDNEFLTGVVLPCDGGKRLT